MTSIQLSWLLPSSTVVAYYQIEYSYIGLCPVPNDPTTILSIPNSMINERLPRYTVTGLEEFSDYSFVITAVNVAGMRSSDPITASTISAGMKYFKSHISHSQLILSQRRLVTHHRLSFLM